MQIDTNSSNVVQIGYRTNGCGYMLAAAESVSSRLTGKSLRDLHGEIDIGVNQRPDCSQAVAQAVKSTLADHRLRLLEEFRGEKALICTCFGVTDETIEHFVASQHPQTVAEVSNAIRAGSGCGSCRMLIQEIIDTNV